MDETEVLALPVELTGLIASGGWPLSEREANRQNLEQAPIPTSLVEQLVPGEQQLYLVPPPFLTIVERCAAGEHAYWHDFGALDQIDPGRSLLIGHFGLGSDTAIILDHRFIDSPPVLRLAWTEGALRPRWIPFFQTFAAFARAFDLENTRWR